jgi:hypothetical protein
VESGKDGGVTVDEAGDVKAGDGQVGGEYADGGGVKTLNGKVVEDEFASDAVNYQILLEKIDRMLEMLKLDA